MDLILVSVPSVVAEGLIVDGDARQPASVRGSDELAQIGFAILGVAADSVSLVMAAEALKGLWRRMIAFVQRNPRAEQLQVQIGKKLTITLDLDELRSQAGGPSVDALAIRAIGQLLVDVADINSE